MSAYVRNITITEALGMGLPDVAADMAHEAAAYGLLTQEPARLVAEDPGCPAWYVTWWRSWAASRAKP